jgi:hypothetical protein
MSDTKCAVSGRVIEVHAKAQIPTGFWLILYELMKKPSLTLIRAAGGVYDFQYFEDA